MSNLEALNEQDLGNKRSLKKMHQTVSCMTKNGTVLNLGMGKIQMSRLSKKSKCYPVRN